MNRFSLLATLAISAASFTAEARAQTLTRTITTSSQRGGLQLHTEHARPVHYRPFRSVSSLASLTCTVDYRVQVVNSGVSDVEVLPAMLRSWPFINNLLCWGNDFGGSGTPSWVGERFTIPAGATQVLSGTQVLTQNNGIPLDASFGPCFGQDDGIHRPSGESLIYAGPTSQFGWWSDDPTITFTDAGTLFTNDLTVTTDYEFPLLTGASVCDPLQPNSTGTTGTLAAFGSADLDDGVLILRAQSLPAASFAFTVIADAAQPATPAGFGLATLCLAAPQTRWLASIALTDGAGEYFAESVPAALPVPIPMAGSSLAFQVFHRDVVAGMQSANSTNAIVVGF